MGPNPDLLVDRESRVYNLFHVPETLGSPDVPVQRAFVRSATASRK